MEAFTSVPVPGSVALLSKAKVNLTLQVLKKRQDGYHDLDSLVAFPDIGDKILIEKAPKLELKVVGRLSNELEVRDNLILRVVSLINSRPRGIRIILDKDIPISAGLGGGSSNAACVMKALCKLWRVPHPSKEQLTSLGADLPVCLNYKLQRMTGIGDKLVTIQEPPKVWILIVNLGESLCTRRIFQSLDRISSPNMRNIPKFKDKDQFIKFLREGSNDLEQIAIKILPSIKNLLEAIRSLDGCLLSRMSGSGASCFGLFNKEFEAQNGYNYLNRLFPHAWIKFGGLFSE